MTTRNPWCSAPLTRSFPTPEMSWRTSPEPTEGPGARRYVFFHPDEEPIRAVGDRLAAAFGRSAASSAAHMTKYSNITDLSTGQKKLIVDDAIVPALALFDHLGDFVLELRRRVQVDLALDGEHAPAGLGFGFEYEVDRPHLPGWPVVGTRTV